MINTQIESESPQQNKKRKDKPQDCVICHENLTINGESHKCSTIVCSGVNGLRRCRKPHCHNKDLASVKKAREILQLIDGASLFRVIQNQILTL